MNELKNSELKKLERLLGYSWSNEVGGRKYPVAGKMIYTDVFEDKENVRVKLGGKLEGKHFIASFNGDRNAQYFNQIELMEPVGRAWVEVRADWGSYSLERELAEIYKETKDLPGAERAGIKSKKIEDFTVTYASAEDLEADKKNHLRNLFDYYIREVAILDVSDERRFNERYF